MRPLRLVQVIPSTLSVSRAAIGLAVLMSIPAGNLLALAGLAALTDFADGYLARRWRVASPVGAGLDLSADGLLFLGFLIAFWRLGRWPGWLAAMVLASAVPQLAAQVLFWLRNGRWGSPGRWWNRAVGGYSYASILAVSADIAPVAIGLGHLVIAWWAHLKDLRLATR